MRNYRLVFLVVTLLTPVAAFAQADGGTGLSISAFGALRSLQNNLSLPHAIGVGGAVAYRTGPLLALQLVIESTHSTQEYETPSSTRSIGIHNTAYRFQTQWLLGDIFELFDLAGIVGFGMMHTKSDAHDISIGALGQRTIPERRETRWLVSVGLSMSHAITNRLSLWVTPEVFLVTPLELRHADYAIMGGIGFALL